MAYELPTVKLIKDNLIRVNHPSPVDPKTQLTANISATGTALTVRNNAGFTNGDLLLFEGYGNEDAEVKKIDGAITLGSALTSTALTFAHSIDCNVEKVLWDQAEISGATTATGTKTVIATVNLQVDGDYTDYIVAGTTYDFYFVRYYNSSTTVYSSYSDALIATDFPPNTVGFVRRNAFENVDQEFSGKFTINWVLDQLYQCELDILKTKDKWSSMVELDYDLGDLTEGQARVALPTDIEDMQTNKAILGLRISGRENMSYVDNAEFHNIMLDVHQTTLASTASVGATTLVLTDSNDFDDEGTVMIGGTNYAYTTNTRSTNTLSGLTALTAEITAGVDIWQGISEAEPTRYAVKDGYVYFDAPLSSDFEGRNVWLDYYKTAQRYTSDMDELLMNDPGLYILWMEMAIKKKKGSGDLPLGDNSWKEYDRRRTLLAMKDKNPYNLRIVPNIPSTTNLSKRFNWWR